MNRLTLIATVLLTVVGIGLVGCGSKTKTKTKTDEVTKSKTDHTDHKSHADHKTDGGSDMDKMKAELAKMSAEDRASAEKQHMCPVSDKMLGSMGAPIKLTVKDQDVWICCEGCKQQVLDDPDTFLAKVKK